MTKERVDNVNTGLTGHQKGCFAISGSIMGMEMDRYAKFIFQCFNQFIGGKRLEQSCHILDRKDMGAHFLQFLGKGNIILKGIFVPLRVSDVTGVANGGLADFPGFTNRIHCHRHSFCPVKRIENPENINSGGRRFFNKTLDDIIRIIGVADSI